MVASAGWLRKPRLSTQPDGTLPRGLPYGSKYRRVTASVEALIVSVLVLCWLASS